MSDVPEYDPRKDSFESYNVAIAAMRAKLLKERCPAAKRVEVIGQAELYLGDCMEIMPTLGKVDAVVTDPPYGIGADKKNAHSSIRDNTAWDDVNWDSKRIDVSALKWHKEVAIWGGNYFADLLPPSGGWLVWRKPQAETGFSLADAELCWTNKPISARMKTFPRRDGNQHPTQKPVSVMEWTLSFIEGLMVLDPFMGSGSTGVACVRTGKAFIGIEKHEPYFEIACERIRKAHQQPDLFVAAPEPKPVQEAMF